MFYALFAVMFLVRSPILFKWAFPACTWQVATAKKEVFLTFDDGPMADVTPEVLDILAAENVKATFFVLGKNVERYPDILERILAEGHAVGNHGFAHPNGWKLPFDEYIADVNRGEATLEAATGKPVQLFRPPYGRLTFKLYRHLQKEYEIIMWHILGGDFSPKMDQERVLQNLTRHTRPGSVLVLHDSVKCREKVNYALPKAIHRLKADGFSFGVLGSKSFDPPAT